MLGLYFLLFSFSLDVAYIYYIFPVFYYSGLELNISLEQNIPIKFIVFSSIGFLMHVLDKRDRLFLFYLSCLVLAPIGVIFSVGGGDKIFFYISVLFVVIVSVIVKLNIVVFPKNPVLKGMKQFLLFVLLFFTLYFLVVKFSGVISLVDFAAEQVALRRFVFSSYYNKVDVYALVWLFSAVLPFLLWKSLVLERRYSALLFFILSLFSLLLTFRKEFYLITAFVIVIYINRKYSINRVYHFVFILIVLSIMFYGDQYIIRYFINRQFVSVGVNQYLYYELANMQDFVLFSNSFLKYFVDYPYDNTIPKLVGAMRYTSEYGNNSNAGVIGSAYIQGGALVVVVYAIIVGLAYNQYKYFDKFTGLDSVGVFSLIFIYKLTNNDLLTALLTGGVVVFFVMVVASYRRGFSERRFFIV